MSYLVRRSCALEDYQPRRDLFVPGWIRNEGLRISSSRMNRFLRPILANRFRNSVLMLSCRAVTARKRSGFRGEALRVLNDAAKEVASWPAWIRNSDPEYLKGKRRPEVNPGG